MQTRICDFADLRTLDDLLAAARSGRLADLIAPGFVLQAWIVNGTVRRKWLHLVTAYRFLALWGDDDPYDQLWKVGWYPRSRWLGLVHETGVCMVRLGGPTE